MARRNRKALAKLARRLKAHVPTSREAGVLQRWSSGGFKKPGSQNRHK